MNSSEIHKEKVLKGKAVHFQRHSKNISKKIPQKVSKEKLSAQTVLKISTLNLVRRKTSTHSVSSTLSLNIILICLSMLILEEKQIKSS